MHLKCMAVIFIMKSEEMVSLYFDKVLYYNLNITE